MSSIFKNKTRFFIFIIKNKENIAVFIATFSFIAYRGVYAAINNKERGIENPALKLTQNIQ